jgi:hypothetical protein
MRLTGANFEFPAVGRPMGGTPSGKLVVSDLLGQIEFAAPKLAVFSSSLLLAVSLFLLARSCLVDSPGELTTGHLVAIGLALGLVVAGHSVLTRQGQPGRRVRVWTSTATYVGCGLIALSVGFHTTDWLGWGLMCAMIGLPMLVRKVPGSRRIRKSLPLAGEPNVGISPTTSQETPLIDEPSESAAELSTIEQDGSIDQVVIRRRDEQGGVVIQARVRGRFEPGERAKNLHVGFCPPLTEIPEVAVEQSAGPDANVGVGQILRTGIRIELRLQQAQRENSSVVVDLYAKSS